MARDRRLPRPERSCAGPGRRQCLPTRDGCRGRRRRCRGDRRSALHLTPLTHLSISRTNVVCARGDRSTCAGSRSGNVTMAPREPMLGRRRRHPAAPHQAHGQVSGEPTSRRSSSRAAATESYVGSELSCRAVLRRHLRLRRVTRQAGPPDSGRWEGARVRPWKHSGAPVGSTGHRARDRGRHVTASPRQECSSVIMGATST